MKWIGQHIYNLASRFRGDVYINRDLYLHQAQGAIIGSDYATFSAGTSVDGRVLYIDSDGKVVNSEDLEYNSASEILTIGDNDNGYATIRRRPRTSSDSAGGHLALEAGQSRGSATGGLVYLGTSAAGSSGSSLNDITEKLILWPNVDVSGFAGSGASLLLDDPSLFKFSSEQGLYITCNSGNNIDVTIT